MTAGAERLACSDNKVWPSKRLLCKVNYSVSLFTDRVAWLGSGRCVLLQGEGSVFFWLWLQTKCIDPHTWNMLAP